MSLLKQLLKILNLKTPPEEDYSEIAHDGSQEASEDLPEHEQSKTTFKYKAAHPETLIIGNKNSPMKTRVALRKEHSVLGLISMIEPTSVDEALSDDGWILSMQEELISSKEMMFGIWLQDHQRRTLLEQNGCSEIISMNKDK